MINYLLGELKGALPLLNERFPLPFLRGEGLRVRG